MARCLIIACGCRGRMLAGELRANGHAVRGTSRRPEGLMAIEDAGAEAHLGDPDRVATLAPAFAQVSVACVLLGSAHGSREALQALHGPRLEMLLTRMLDTTIRGVVYEASGTVDAAVLQGGEAVVRRACEGSRIPFALLRTEPDATAAWSAEAVSAVLALLAPPA